MNLKIAESVDHLIPGQDPSRRKQQSMPAITFAGRQSLTIQIDQTRKIIVVHEACNMKPAKQQGRCAKFSLVLRQNNPLHQWPAEDDPIINGARSSRNASMTSAWAKNLASADLNFVSALASKTMQRHPST